MPLIWSLISIYMLMLVERSESANPFDIVPRGYLSSHQDQLFEESLSLLEAGQCRQDLLILLQALRSNRIWAIRMFDASARDQLGVASGVLYQMGHYDQCLQQQASLEESNGGNHSTTDLDQWRKVSPPVLAQYCLIEVSIDELGHTQKIVSRQQHMESGSLLVNASVNKPHLVSHWGVCVPASCNSGDLEVHLGYFMERSGRVRVSPDQCQVKHNHEEFLLSADGGNHTGMIIYACIILVFVLLSVLSTGYHVYLMNYERKEGIGKSNDSDRDTVTSILLSFSVIANTGKLLQASRDQWSLNPINGIKSLAMMMILAGHSLTFVYSNPAYNVEFIAEKIKWPIFAFLSNSLLFVDIFLLLSGFLFCRLLLIELERRHGKLNFSILYVARYLRLTPAYLAVIGFYMTWFIRLGDGPLWPSRILREQKRCQASWWLNILYINNYINADKLCMFQSWYLAVDSQLFFVAPLVIYLLYRSHKNGLRLLSVLVVVSTLVPILITYQKHLDPTLMVYPDEVADLISNEYYKDSYIKTHMRFSAYMIGLLTGYVVHRMQVNSLRIPNWLIGVLWLMAVIVGVGSMFSVSRFYSSSFDTLESAMYAGFHKLGWNLSVAWLVISVTTVQHSGRLAKILGGRFFAPISRLTYCAYLSNGIIELYHSSSTRTLMYMSYVSLFNFIFGHILNTFALALVLCLLFESPIHALEGILLRKFSPSSSSRKLSVLEKVQSDVTCHSEIMNGSTKKEILSPV